MNLPNGHILQSGKYRITHVIGQGGFGITYKGVWFTEVKGALGTVKTEVPICIKEYFFKDYCYRDTESFTVKVHSETGRVLFNKFKEKLIKEAKILSEVHHPHIVNVLEVFEENGTAYIAMEYISGSSLKYRMDREGRLSEDKVLRYVRQIGEALQFVHEKNILHLDIKPSNILIDAAGKARLIDFGVSKRYDIEQQETSTTMLTLSKGFASIEQYDNEGTLSFSPCPDIYSLGATMYNLLTGKIPTESILRATRPLQKPTDINPEITQKTEATILKAMQIIPVDRFQAVQEMMDALDFPQTKEEPDRDLHGFETEHSEDETTLLQASALSANDDNEQTVLKENTEFTPLTPIINKKKKKGLLLSVVITIFACVGSVAFFLAQGRKPVKDSTELIGRIPEIALPETEKIQQKSETEKVKEEIVDSKMETTVHKEQDKVAVQSNTAVSSNQVVADKPSVAEVSKLSLQPAEPTAEEIEVAYSTLISSGKTKMNNADYANAKKDFTKAKETKLTEEVVRLLIACDTKEAEKYLADRKALYEEKMTFGKYKIVRKISTGKYGAIDANAEERIPCKYLNVGIADNGRAFEREDGLFDIYGTDGALVSKGLTYY